MQVGKEKVVEIDYTLTNEQGEVLDSSKGRGPLAYVHGVGGLIAGLERELEGKNAGDRLNVKVDPEQGYGQRNPGMVQSVPKSAFKTTQDVQPGMQFQAQTPQGPVTVTVTDVTDDQVTVDANHPLAGVPLNFDVTVVNVRDATVEELQHGHAHGAGGHQH
jgi:FKBP-type peptidyl-prolyl cis-trans isomerase SlyD